MTGLSEDTGTPGDFNTSDTTLVFSGTAENADGKTVVLSVGDTQLGSAVIANGKWELDATATEFKHGNYELLVRLGDGNGVVPDNPVEVKQAFTVDTSPTHNPNNPPEGANPGVGDNNPNDDPVDPNAPPNKSDNDTAAADKKIVLAVTGLSEDTGTPGDFNTSDTTLVFSGTAENADGKTVVLSVGDTQLGSAVIANGKWELDATATEFKHGNYELLVRLGDGNGVVPDNPVEVKQAFTVDTSPTHNPNNPPEGANPGVGDNNPNDDPVDPNAPPNKSDNDTAAADKKIVLAVTGLSEDTGTPGDFNTSDTTLVFSGTAENADGKTVVLSVGDTQLGSAVIANGKWELDATATEFKHGNYELLVRLGDGNGVVPDNPVEVKQAFTVDTSPTHNPNNPPEGANPGVGDNNPNDDPVDPNAPPNKSDNDTAAADKKIVLAVTGLSEDTGTPGDFNTSDTTLVFSGTAENADGKTVVLSVGDTQVFRLALAAR